ncbi:type I polyketide synthase [Streptomyces chilikensis]|uniref:Beta-ketoacyl synthase N-terminal-like domain-containing protein n=1 Tax=Streptomyces chilikensis TaxID=1194079 RepID=A0ABV3EZU4_9ACTN
MSRDRSLDIAVTGIAARFPGAPDLAAWWEAVLAGEVLTRRYERADLVGAGVDPRLVDDPDHVPVHGHLDDADRFENELFRVSPREAEMMDPQHRLMLETAWAALEDAGCAPRSPRLPTTAVFATASSSGYLRSMVASGLLDPLTLEDALHGTEPDFMASLISYRLGLTGPAIAVQTACSSSLVAVHLAAQALQNGDCDQALVVGAGIAHPQHGHLHVPGGIHSATGECRPFDAEADGVVSGSGVAAVVLRRLADTEEEPGPRPYGVLLGTAVNNDGSAKAGYYAPSVDGQEAVIRAAVAAADVPADSIGYLEAHATGTRVGDPIEWAAASAGYGGLGAPPRSIAVGALKATTGHLDNAAGVASLIKTLLVVKEGVIPPVAGFRRLNPLLETDGSPLYVPAEAVAWPGPGPRRAAVSSFGVGGTNAHVIVEQPPAPPRRGAPAPAGTGHLLLLSAQDPAALDRTADRLATHLERQAADTADAVARGAGDGGTAEPVGLGDVAVTLATGRAELPARLAVTARDAAEAAERLRTGRHAARATAPGTPAPVVLLFPGQGAQRPGMALPLRDALPGFGAALEECLAAFPEDVVDEVRRALLDPGFPAERLAATDLAQPALFAVEYAAARALRALGLAPVALAGHSLGEITAIAVAGGLAPADAARLVTARGRAMAACPPGAMIALECDPATALALAEESGLHLELAAHNTPESCVLAGPAEEADRFLDRIGGRVHARRLRTGHAFHSALIEPALPKLEAVLEELAPRCTTLPVAANRTGELLPPGSALFAEHYVDQARGTVRFAESLAAVARRYPGAVAVEAGPGRALSAMAAAAGLTPVPLCGGRTDRPAEETLAALGTLWTLGQPLSTAALCGPGEPVHLPGYPFAGPRWIAPEAAARQAPPAPEPAAATAGAAATGAAADPAGEPERPGDPGRVLAALWADLLGRTELADDADFFALGGDSLLTTHLARRIKLELGVTVPIREMFMARTLGRQREIVRDLLAARDAVPAG